MESNSFCAHLKMASLKETHLEDVEGVESLEEQEFEDGRDGYSNVVLSIHNATTKLLQPGEPLE